MKRHFSNLALVFGFLAILIGSVSAQDLVAVEKQCAITKAKAIVAHLKCFTKEAIKGTKKDLSKDEVNQLVEPCGLKLARKFEKAEARAVAKGGQCAIIGGAPEVQEALVNFIFPPDNPQNLGCSPFVSQHDNYVYFNSFSSLQMDFTGHSITSCQPWGGASVNGSQGFLIKAGRHDSSGPAGFFKNGLDSGEMLTTADLGDSEPSELNFAVAGNMTATWTDPPNPGSQTFTCSDFRIGQGSSDATNNWWAGQPGAYPCKSNPVNGQVGLGLNCTSTSGQGTTLMLFQVIGIPGYDNAYGVTVVEAGKCS